MNLLLVSHYFPPEIGAPQARLSEFARAWADSGHDVTVLTGVPNHPNGVVPAEYVGMRFRRESLDGYDVVRTWTYATPNEGFARKIIGHLSFMLTSVLQGAFRVGRPDVVVVSSPTFFSIFSAWIIARLWRARLVVEVRDLWPAIFIELGVLRNPGLIRLLEWLELRAYRAADRVVLVTEGFKDQLIARGVPSDKLDVIRNGVDLNMFEAKGERSAAVRQQLGATSDDDVLVLYIGAHGISQALSSVADAAAILRDHATVRFVFVGEGAEKEQLRARVSAMGLENVLLHPGIPRADVPGVLQAADICLAPLRDVPMFATFIPSKIFEYMGAERAVIGSVRGESARILEDAGALVVPPEDPEALAAAIAKLARDAALRTEMGVSGRRHVEQHFDRQRLADDYASILMRTMETER
jgi:glycosyltransferase involved in cell wall biosynthesis